MGDSASGVILDPLTGAVLEHDQLDGISGRLKYSHDLLKLLHIFFITVTWWNAIELMVLVLSTFRRRKGLYFWSLVVTNCLGVVPYSLGFLIQFFTEVNVAVSTAVVCVGWVFMVTGQSVVLYSRLHLVLRDKVVLRRVLCMIAVNIFLLHVPDIVISWVGTFAESAKIIRAFNVMDKVQLVGFTVQEFIISALYIWEAIKLLRLRSDRQDRRIMYYLVGINAAMFVMDLILVSVQFANYFAIQSTLQGMFYSIKLKLEFAVLGKLVDVIQQGSSRNGSLGYAMQLSSLDHIEVQTGTTATPSSALSSDLNVDDRRQGIRLSEGNIFVTKEFLAWVERRPHGNRLL
ncbi:uncharacterized protein BDW47DRAFT_52631 [Aspergillus candidus]|uniref:DUF7703 domain-containing protein n=1 Tax=Aspergillus candidus TaxID=41067 RepID=A0A2I2F6L3_ASPCN|nr:hypothetical protein BDW47DRAFT_52631 [Aspergillus candidus]PLB36285.1 hypothetical protein BDW47DRAFT_52631 [Aspergillus candidus]